MGSLRRLERIVVDEFHYVLLTHNSYRPHLRNLRTIAQYALRVTLLSATVPYEQQSYAFRLMGFPESVVTFRESTVRTNVHYQVYHFPSREPVTIRQLADYVRSQQDDFKKILTYVDHRSTAETLAGMLQCNLFHGDMSDSEKAAQQDEFSAASTGLLIATSAFSAGVHMAFLPAVFQFGKPDSLVS